MIWTVLYWVFLGFAGIAALRALLWDRPGRRGRSKLRCRKCWYDLSKAEGLEAVGRDHPVTCPECGRAHVSLLSMSRTRRHPRQLALAVVLLVLAYAAQATPKIQSGGWSYAIPDAGLILTMPFLSEEPGSSMSFYDPKYTTTKFQESILDQLSKEHGAGQSKRAGSFGWLDCRLVMMLAKREPIGVITDSSTAKGNAFKSVLSTIARNNGMSSEEEAWFNKQIYIEMDHPDTIAGDQIMYGTMRVRRLKDRSYRLSIGNGDAFMKGYPTMGATIRSRVDPPRRGGSPEGPISEIEAFQWDSTFLVDRDGHLIHFDTIPLGGAWNIASETQITTPIEIYEESSGRFGNEHWERVGYTSVRSKVNINTELSVQLDESVESREDIESRLNAKLKLVHSRQQEKWVPVIEFKAMSLRHQFSAKSFVFGGELDVYFKLDSSDTNGRVPSRALPVLSSEKHTWSVIPRKRIEARGIQPVPTPGEVKYTGYMFPIHPDAEGHYVVRVKPLRAGRFYNLGGVDANVYYSGELEFEIPNWTPEEMTQFIVNGIAPEHAMSYLGN